MTHSTDDFDRLFAPALRRLIEVCDEGMTPRRRPPAGTQFAHDESGLRPFSMWWRTHEQLNDARRDLDAWFLELLLDGRAAADDENFDRCNYDSFEPGEWAQVLQQAITRAAQVIWVLGPDSRSQRVRNYLDFELEETNALRRALKAGGLPVAEADVRGLELVKIARQQGVHVLGGVPMREMLDHATAWSGVGSALRSVHGLLGLVAFGSGAALDALARIPIEGDNRPPANAFGDHVWGLYKTDRAVAVALTATLRTLIQAQQLFAAASAEARTGMPSA